MVADDNSVQTWRLFLFIKSSENSRFSLPRNDVVDFAVVKMRTSSNKSNCCCVCVCVPVCMNTGITHCLVPKAATVKWQQLHRNSSHYRMVLGSSISQLPHPKSLATLLSRNQMAPSEMNPPNSKPIIRNIATDVKLTLLPMSRNVLHFRAVDVASPPFRSESVSFPPDRTSVSRVPPPANTPRKAGSQNNDQRGFRSYESLNVSSFPHATRTKTPNVSSHSIPSY